MATNSEVKKAKPRKVYPKKIFCVGQLGWCCGVGEIGGFEDEARYYSWFDTRRSLAKKLYFTREEQAEACYKDILERTTKEDGDGYYVQLLLTLVSSYGPENGKTAGSAQFPELEEILIREGWTIASVFINPSHGNEVTMYTKYFPERHMTVKEFEEMDGGW